jgi:hypothetical protein
VKEPQRIKSSDTRLDLEAAPVQTVEAGGISGNLSRRITGTRHAPAGSRPCYCAHLVHSLWTSERMLQQIYVPAQGKQPHFTI